MTSDGSLINDDGTRYNYAAVAQMLNPSKRDSMGAFGEFEIEGVGTAYMEMNYSTFNTNAGIAQSGTFFNDEYQLLFDNESLTMNGKLQLIMHLLMVLTMLMVV